MAYAVLFAGEKAVSRGEAEASELFWAAVKSSWHSRAQLQSHRRESETHTYAHARARTHTHTKNLSAASAILSPTFSTHLTR